MTKNFGIADSMAVGTFNTSLLQTAADMMPQDIIDITSIPLYNDNAEVKEFLPALTSSAPFSRTFIASSFELAAHPRFMDEWNELAQAMPARMPFQTAEWNKTWWSHFQRRGIFLKDDLHLLCAVRDERIVGIVPLFKTTIGLPGLPVFRYLRLLGADRNLTEWRSVICREEDRKALQALWVKEAKRFKFGVCFFHFRGFTEEEVAAAKFNDIGFVKVLQPPSENFILTLADSWDAFKSKLKRNIKESLRHCYNSIKHASLELSVNVIGDADALRSKMPQFYHWHTLRAGNTTTVTHPDYFKKIQHREFIESLATGLCPRGQMKLFELKLNGNAVAYRLIFIQRDTLYLYFSAYDPEYSKYSVMTTLVAEAIKWAIDQKIKYVNLSFGRDNSKVRWGPVESHSYDVLAGNRGVWLIDAYREKIAIGRKHVIDFRKWLRRSPDPV